MRAQYKITILCLLFTALCAGFCGCGIRSASDAGFDDSAKNGGIYLTKPSEVETLKVKPDILGWFEAWGSSFAAAKGELCVKEGITPLITWEPYDYALTDISNGEYDALIRDYLMQINQRFGKKTVLIRLAHEMECCYPDSEPWYPWQYYGGEQDYIDMWRHVVTIGHEVAPNVRWIWSPNRINEKSAKWYPGDDYVDYVGITLNHESNHTPTYTRFEDYYKKEGRAGCFEQFHKKVLLSEVAYAGRDEKVRGEYLKSIFDWVEQDDRICGVVFWNNNTSKNRQYRFSDNDYYMNIWYDGMRRLHKAAAADE